MEDGGGQHSIGASAHSRCEVLKFAGAAGCDERNRDVRANVADQLEVESLLGAVSVHGVQEDLADAAFLSFTHPFESVQAGAPLAAVRGHLIAGGGISATHIGGEHEDLRTEAVDDFADDFGAGDGGGVDRRFVGTCAQQPVDVVSGADSPADCQGDENLLCGLLHHVVQGFAVPTGGADVEERQFVSPAGAVALGEFNGVADVFQPLEVHAFDYAPAVNVETWDDSHGRHQIPSFR